MRRKSGIKPVLLAALIALVPSYASAIGFITDGDVTFEYTADFDTARRDTVDIAFTGAGTGDMAFESWWFFRVQGDSLETALGTPDFEDYTAPYHALSLMIRAGRVSSPRC